MKPSDAPEFSDSPALEALFRAPVVRARDGLAETVLTRVRAGEDPAEEALDGLLAAAPVAPRAGLAEAVLARLRTEEDAALDGAVDDLLAAPVAEARSNLADRVLARLRAGEEPLGEAVDAALAEPVVAFGAAPAVEPVRPARRARGGVVPFPVWIGAVILAQAALLVLTVAILWQSPPPADPVPPPARTPDQTAAATLPGAALGTAVAALPDANALANPPPAIPEAPEVLSDDDLLLLADALLGDGAEGLLDAETLESLASLEFE